MASHEEVTAPDEDALRAAINAAPWRKTTYIRPHAYIHANRVSQDIFKTISDRIEQDGRYGCFLRIRRAFKYLIFDGYRYWEMGDGKGGRLINRAEHTEGDIQWQ